MRVSHSITKSPKFKFGQMVRYTTEFHGTMEGVVRDVNEITTGHLWWKKVTLVYTVDIDYGEYSVTGYLEEDKLSEIPPRLKPVR